jgi:hypothetical protein
MGEVRRKDVILALPSGYFSHNWIERDTLRSAQVRRISWVRRA